MSDDPLDKHVHPTEWAIILGDWKRSDAWVTVHLRSGATLGPGRVTRLPGVAIDSAELTHHARRHDEREKRWTFDLNDVAALTAEASR
jgi:hypothetical protein